MSRRKRHPPGERFLLLPYKLAMQLHAPHLTVLLDIARRHNGQNNGAIGYGCRDAARVAHIRSESAMLVLNQLRRDGHIVLRQERTFSMKAGRATREWYVPFLARERGLYKGERSLDLPFWFLDSPGWRAATATERKIYVELERRYDGNNNGRIIFTTEDGALLGLSDERGIYRALNGLQRRGFVVETVSADPLKGAARQWRLTRYRANGKKETKEFMAAPKNSDFGFPCVTSEPVTVSPVSLGNQRGTPDQAAPTAKNLSKHLLINKPVARAPSDTRETVGPSASDTRETHIDNHPSPSSSRRLEPASTASAPVAHPRVKTKSASADPALSGGSSVPSRSVPSNAAPSPRPRNRRRSSR